MSYLNDVNYLKGSLKQMHRFYDSETSQFSLKCSIKYCTPPYNQLPIHTKFPPTLLSVSPCCFHLLQIAEGTKSQSHPVSGEIQVCDTKLLL